MRYIDYSTPLPKLVVFVFVVVHFPHRERHFPAAQGTVNNALACFSHMNPLLTTADSIVLRNLLHDASSSGDSSKARSDQISKDALAALTDDCSDAFETTVFTGWDRKVLPDWLSDKLLLPYILWAQGVVRRRTDVVFLTHIMLYLLTSVPSALMLYYRFSYTHAVGHWLMQAYYCGPFTLLLHNHIHNGGVLAKKYAWFDSIFPYILEPLMGHTWDSYYYHHVKHHHVEGNGPEDLSSTLRYQRDDLFDFILYVLRFMTLVWIELPLYFLRKHKRSLAIRCLVSEISTLLAIYLLAIRYPRPTTFVFILPHIMMRIGMMVGNWAQHAFIDEIDPASDFRSSITLIDVAVCCSVFLT